METTENAKNTKNRLLMSAPTIAMVAMGLLSTAHAANPSFSDFDTAWFGTDGRKVTMKNTPSFGSFDASQFAAGSGAVTLTGMRPMNAFPLVTWAGPSAGLDLTVPEQAYEATANCTVTGFQNLLNSRRMTSRLLIYNSSGSSITVSWPAAVESADGNASASCANGRTLVVTFTTHGGFVMAAPRQLWSQNPPAIVATTTIVTPSSNPSVFGQSVCLDPTVNSGPVLTPFPPDLVGTVSFADGGTTLGFSFLSGPPRFCISSFGVGTHSITGTYNGGNDDEGNPYYDVSTSAVVSLVVNKADTSVAISSSCNPCGAGGSVIFTASVSAMAPGSGIATGTVTFKDAGVVIGTAVVSSGRATYTTSALASGSHPITAEHGGDGNFNSGVSAVYTEQIN